MLASVESRKSKVERQNRSIMYLLPVASCLLPVALNAQCAMCRASLESTGNVSQAEAVNDGIVYLMIIPYILVALIAFAVYRMYRKKK
jgi:hypothetical protein